MEDVSVTSSEEESNIRPDEESDEESDADNNDNPDDVSFHRVLFAYMYLIFFSCECCYIFYINLFLSNSCLLSDGGVSGRKLNKI